MLHVLKSGVKTGCGFDGGYRKLGAYSLSHSKPSGSNSGSKNNCGKDLIDVGSGYFGILGSGKMDLDKFGFELNNSNLIDAAVDHRPSFEGRNEIGPVISTSAGVTKASPTPINQLPTFIFAAF